MSQVATLLEGPHTFAVVGVSQDVSKYGYELFEELRAHGHNVLPVNPKYDKIDKQVCYSSLSALPQVPDAVITAVPPPAAARIAQTCAEQNIPVFWMPPGTETDEALEICRNNQVTAIHGICTVFVLKLPRERWQELP